MNEATAWASARVGGTGVGVVAGFAFGRAEALPEAFGGEQHVALLTLLGWQWQFGSGLGHWSGSCLVGCWHIRQSSE